MSKVLLNAPTTIPNSYNPTSAIRQQDKLYYNSHFVAVLRIELDAVAIDLEKRYGDGRALFLDTRRGLKISGRRFSISSASTSSTQSDDDERSATDQKGLASMIVSAME